MSTNNFQNPSENDSIDSGILSSQTTSLVSVESAASNASSEQTVPAVEDDIFVTPEILRERRDNKKHGFATTTPMRIRVTENDDVKEFRLQPLVYPDTNRQRYVSNSEVETELSTGKSSLLKIDSTPDRVDENALKKEFRENGLFEAWMFEKNDKPEKTGKKKKKGGKKSKGGKNYNNGAAPTSSLTNIGDGGKTDGGEVEKENGKINAKLSGNTRNTSEQQNVQSNTETNKDFGSFGESKFSTPGRSSGIKSNAPVLSYADESSFQLSSREISPQLVPEKKQTASTPQNRTSPAQNNISPPKNLLPHYKYSQAVKAAQNPEDKARKERLSKEYEAEVERLRAPPVEQSNFADEYTSQQQGYGGQSYGQNNGQNNGCALPIPKTSMAYIFKTDSSKTLNSVGLKNQVFNQDQSLRANQEMEKGNEFQEVGSRNARRSETQRCKPGLPIESMMKLLVSLSEFGDMYLKNESGNFGICISLNDEITTLQSQIGKLGKKDTRSEMDCLFGKLMTCYYKTHDFWFKGRKTSRVVNFVKTKKKKLFARLLFFTRPVRNLHCHPGKKNDDLHDPPHYANDPACVAQCDAVLQAAVDILNTGVGGTDIEEGPFFGAALAGKVEITHFEILENLRKTEFYYHTIIPEILDGLCFEMDHQIRLQTK